MPFASIDFETRSAVDLRKCGADVYAEDKSTSILCMAWAIDDGPVHVWSPGDPDPQPLLDHIRAGGVVRGWNVAFELAIWRHVVRRQCPGWPPLKIEQAECTMARALALSFPGSLDACAPALRLDIRKDAEGHRIMMQVSKPKPRRKAAPGAPPVWDEDPEKIARLKAYCRQDVIVEREIAKRLAPLPGREQRIWRLDQKINQRGVAIDLVSAARAREIIEDETKQLNAELFEITDGWAGKATNPRAIKAWLDNVHSIALGSMAKDTVRETLALDDLPPAVRRALEIRAEAGRASTAKLKAMESSANSDGRARGMFFYHGATTGRWSGRRIQLQNLPRPTIGEDEIEQVIALLGTPNAADCIRFSFTDPFSAVASSLRALLVPGPGRKFIGGDFSNIEGRVLAWLAGERWKLEAFRAFDRGEGADLYKLAYGRSFGVDPEHVTKAQRQIGKVQELALGYAGGPAAFLSMAANYDANIPEIAAATIAAAGPTAWTEHLERLARWQFAAAHYGRLKDQLTYNEWAALKLIVGRWRDAHPKTKSLWHDLNDCAMRATQRKGTVEETESGMIRFVSTGAILFMQLPSGRSLAYPYPHLAYEIDEDTGERQLGLRYYANDQNNRWGPQRLYGGLLAENASQATARDILVDSMFRAEKAGLPIVLHVHDEQLSEVPIEHPITTEDYRKLMCASEAWAATLPVAAECHEMARYGK